MPNGPDPIVAQPDRRLRRLTRYGGSSTGNVYSPREPTGCPHTARGELHRSARVARSNPACAVGSVSAGPEGAASGLPAGSDRPQADAGSHPGGALLDRTAAVRRDAAPGV